MLPGSATTRFAVGGLGAALPDRVVTNDDMAQYLDTSDDWIMARTGIRQRRMAGPGESTGQLAVAAARAALAEAGTDPADLDMIVVATATPDHPLPSTAAEVAAALGCDAGAFDVNAACAGFVYGLTVAGAFVETGLAETVLLIGADTMSRVIDQDDRSLAVLFGDGAGAMVLHPSPDIDDRAATGGLVACDLVDDPDAADLLVIPAGGSIEPASHESVAAGRHYMTMDGSEVFRKAVRGVADSVTRTLDRAGRTPDEVDLFIPHQANARIIEALLNRMGIPASRAVQTVDRHGNTSAASVPLALAEAAAAGRVDDGSLILTSGFGAGFTIGTALMRWQRP